MNRYLLTAFLLALLGSCSGYGSLREQLAGSLLQCAVVPEREVTLTLTRALTVPAGALTRQIGVFTVENRSTSVVQLETVIEEGRLTIPYPVAWSQINKGNWQDIVPMIGSFDLSSSQELAVAPGKSATVHMDISAGVPKGINTLRQVVRTLSDDCLVSKPFSLTVSE